MKQGMPVFATFAQHVVDDWIRCKVARGPCPRSSPDGRRDPVYPRVFGARGKYRAFRVAKSGSHPFGRRMAERCGPERGGADTSVHQENGKGRGLHPNGKGA